MKTELMKVKTCGNLGIFAILCVISHLLIISRFIDTFDPFCEKKGFRLCENKDAD